MQSRRCVAISFLVNVRTRLIFCLMFSVAYVSFHVLPDLSKPNQYLIFMLILYKYFQTLLSLYVLFLMMQGFHILHPRTNGLTVKNAMEKVVSSAVWEDNTVPESH